MTLYRVLFHNGESKRSVAADDWQRVDDTINFFAKGKVVASFDNSAVKGVEVVEEDHNPDASSGPTQEKSPYIDFTDYDK